MIRATNRLGIRLAVLAGIALFSLACGGGGGPDSPTSTGVASVAEVEYLSFQLANSARSDSHVQPLLDRNDEVATIARRHSESMRDQGFFDHNGPDGSIGARLRAAGISFSAAGENLAKLTSASDPAAQAHSMFMSSPEHRQVILDSRFRLAGVGVARSGSQYWLTQIYIRP